MHDSRRTHPFNIAERTFEFARDVVSACRQLESRSWVAKTLGGQLLRAGTSIGANMEEAQAAQSRRDFVSKSTISLKEARETRYWLRLMRASGVLPEAVAEPLDKEADELARIIGSIVVRTKRNTP
jgi:four helix bundle protein